MITRDEAGRIAARMRAQRRLAERLLWHRRILLALVLLLSFLLAQALR